MSFDLTAARLVWLTVAFKGMRSQGDDIAEPIEHKVDLQVELVDLNEFSRLFVSPLDENGDPLPGANPPATPERIEEWRKMNDTSRAQAVVKDWRGVSSGGVKMPFSPENLAKLMLIPNFALSLFRHAYPAAYLGAKDTRLGNSESSPASGPASDDAQ